MFFKVDNVRVAKKTFESHSYPHVIGEKTKKRPGKSEQFVDTLRCITAYVHYIETESTHPHPLFLFSGHVANWGIWRGESGIPSTPIYVKRRQRQNFVNTNHITREGGGKESLDQKQRRGGENPKCICKEEKIRRRAFELSGVGRYFHGKISGVVAEATFL